MHQTPTTTEGSGSAPESPDLDGYRAAHAALRASTRQLVVGLEAVQTGDRARIPAIQRWFSGLRGELDVHHRNEDLIFFPALSARVPSYSQYAPTIDTDHHRLDDLLGRVGRGLEAGSPGDALGAAIELDAHLAEHLDLEDADILPLFERHFSVAEYAALEEAALRSVSLRQALFTVPWFLAMAPADVGARLLAEAPAAMRIVERLTRRRYARLVRAAFGPRPVELAEARS